LAGGNLECGRERDVFGGEHRLEQRLAHASAAAGNDNTRRRFAHCHQPNFFSNSTSQLSSPVLGAIDSDLSSAAAPLPERATSPGGGGISSPSQRASRSSTK